MPKLFPKNGAFLILIEKKVFRVLNTFKVSFEFENDLFILTTCSSSLSADYRNYLNDRRGPNLIFYLSEGALIPGGTHLSRGAH